MAEPVEGVVVLIIKQLCHRNARIFEKLRVNNLIDLNNLAREYHLI